MTRRGEFKTPGGKLIAVEFEIDDGVLRDVVVSGDFFLYPEESLPAIAAALEGSPATLSASDFAARVAAVLGDDVVLFGSSPEALASAVVRALHAEDAAGAADGD